MIFSNMTIESSNPFPILVDNTPRYCKEPKKGTIRSIAFENLMVSSPGRIYVEGLPDRPIQNLSFRNIVWNVTGPLSDGTIRKPAGARRTERDPDAPNYADQPYHLVAAYAENLEVSGFHLQDMTEGKTASRGFARLIGVHGATFERIRALPTLAGLPLTQFEGSDGIECGLKRGI
jgi:hypothetical protein